MKSSQAPSGGNAAMIAAMPAGQIAPQATTQTQTTPAWGGSRGMIDTTQTPGASNSRFPGIQQQGADVMDALRRGDLNAYNEKLGTLLRSHLLRFGGDRIANAMQTSSPSQAIQARLMGR